MPSRIYTPTDAERRTQALAGIAWAYFTAASRRDTAAGRQTLDAWNALWDDIGATSSIGSRAFADPREAMAQAIVSARCTAEIRTTDAGVPNCIAAVPAAVMGAWLNGSNQAAAWAQNILPLVNPSNSSLERYYADMDSNAQGGASAAQLVSIAMAWAGAGTQLGPVTVRGGGGLFIVLLLGAGAWYWARRRAS